MKSLKLKQAAVSFLLGVFIFAPAVSAASAENIQTKQGWGRDPFTAAELDMVTIDTIVEDHKERVVEPERTYELTGILARGDRQTAIINRTLVREGDEIEGAEVVSISGDAVTLKIHDKEKVIKIGAS